ncbi:hypothetical protein OICFNHDK_4455 [Methylobacterium bullatum]|uniref:Uncharacterized protein n=1 Tax=Methylobacterium bullatum TaxID=570505 RepID=A0AAV4ZE68_9HYPH|nr:hypothetical protein OICFNHDK_4455 [Methylobacterium bullatum]
MRFTRRRDTTTRLTALASDRRLLIRKASLTGACSHRGAKLSTSRIDALYHICVENRYPTCLWNYRMKRTSARPVVVEVKRSRTSPSPMADTFGRNLSGKTLWQGVHLHDVPPSTPKTVEAISTPVHQPTICEPTRRILPAITPMFTFDEPEPQQEVAEVSRVTRKVRSIPKSRFPGTVLPVVSPSEVLQLATDGPGAAACVAKPETAKIDESAVLPHGNEFRLIRPERRSHQPVLNRGERWKRRLPRACW